MKKLKRALIAFLVTILTVNVVSLGFANSASADTTKLNLNARAAYALSLIHI